MDNLNESVVLKPKKEFRKKVRAILMSSFAEYKNGLSDKAFNAAMKRASKLLANDLYVKEKKEKKGKGKVGQLESLVM